MLPGAPITAVAGAVPVAATATPLTRPPAPAQAHPVQQQHAIAQQIAAQQAVAMQIAAKAVAMQQMQQQRDGQAAAYAAGFNAAGWMPSGSATTSQQAFNGAGWMPSGSATTSQQAMLGHSSCASFQGSANPALRQGIVHASATHVQQITPPHTAISQLASSGCFPRAVCVCASTASASTASAPTGGNTVPSAAVVPGGERKAMDLEAFLAAQARAREQAKLAYAARQAATEAANAAARDAAARAAPPPAPAAPSSAPAAKLELALNAPHGVRDEHQRLTADKRAIFVQVQARDSSGVHTSEPLALRASLAYEDGEPLPPEAQAAALGGTLALTATNGEATFKLRPCVVSRNYAMRRFCVLISPQDAGIAQSRPGLTQRTEPFVVVSNTTPTYTKREKPSASLLHPRVGNPQFLGSGIAPTITKSPHGAAAAAIGGDVGDPAAGGGAAPTHDGSAAALSRRRYFAADALREAMAPSPGAAAAPLAHSAVAVCDRLAAIIAQKLTQRSWQYARRTRVGARTLRPADVAAVVGRDGLFDFLFQAGVVKEWQDQEPAPAARAPAPAAGVPVAAPSALASAPPAAALESSSLLPSSTSSTLESSSLLPSSTS